MTWDYTKTEYEKQAKKDPVWELERLINYGLGKEKIDKKNLKNIWPNLKFPMTAGLFLNCFCGTKNSNPYPRNNNQKSGRRTKTG